jgi:hypothetical protein
MNQCTGAMDLIYGPMDLFHGISLRKIIPLNPKNHRTPYFYKKHPKLFQNYILVPKILHLGLYLSFYNYN